MSRISRAGERGAERPVAGGQELVVDQVADHLQPAAAEQVGGDEVADREDEDEHGTHGHAGQGERQGDVAEGGPGPGAQVGRGLAQLRVEAAHRGVDREHDEGHVVVDQPGHDRELVVEQRQGLAGPAQPGQEAVDQALAVEQHDPGIGADQVVAPEGQGDQDQEHRLPAPGAQRDGVGGGVGDQQGHRRGGGGDPGRVERGCRGRAGRVPERDWPCRRRSSRSPP